MSEAIPSLDPLLHQPTRTQVVAFLSSRGEATFSELKRVLGVTDGNLGAHLGKLVEAGLIDSHEDTGSGRSQTIFTLTSHGRILLAEYVTHLSTLMEMSTAATPEKDAFSKGTNKKLKV